MPFGGLDGDLRTGLDLVCEPRIRRCSSPKIRVSLRGPNTTASGCSFSPTLIPNSWVSRRGGGGGGVRVELPKKLLSLPRGGGTGLSGWDRGTSWGVG